jgi:hypothetical protein
MSDFGSIMISDHVAVTPDVRSEHPAPFFEPVYSAELAGITKTIELGTT